MKTTNATSGLQKYKNRLVLISCYYGSFPEWMDLWLLTCGWNPDIDFLLVSDLALPERPQNVHLLPLTMEELRERFSRVLGFDAALSTPYKLCDYKPLYGLAFREELKGYAFWGHCDLDIIWGRLGHFLTDEVLDVYPRIGVFGHCIAYRNDEEMNNLYRKEGAAFPYMTVFRDDAHYGFDELTGMNLILEKHGIPYYKDFPVADANWLLPRVSADAVKSGEEFYCWWKGRILCARVRDGRVWVKEYAYLHFQKKKPLYRKDAAYANGFYIKANAFVPRKPGRFTVEEVERESEFLGPFRDYADVAKGQSKRAVELLFCKSRHEKKILLVKKCKHLAFQLQCKK